MKRSYYLYRGLALVLCVLLILCLLPGRTVRSQTARIIFLHHSCGQNLIDQGGVREGLSDLGYEFYDHGYNGDGLRLADGSSTGTNFDVPDDNTDPSGLAVIFAQPLHDPPDNTFSYLMQYDVIIFKSCFPNSNIGSDEQLAEFQGYYLSIRDRADEYPNKLFIVVTQPPQVPGSSNPEEATRARALADWLASDEFLSGHPNVTTFNFFDQLAGGDNFLRPEYRVDDYDAHPNETANQTIGPIFVAFVNEAISAYWRGEAPPADEGEGEEPVAEPVEEEPGAGGPPASGVVDSLDVFAEGTWSETDGTGSTISCTADGGNAHSGAAALRMDYELVGGGWADCGRSFDTPQDWSAGDGLALWLRADAAGQEVTLILHSGDAATPFEGFFAAEGADWTQVVLPWDSFARATWADEGGLDELDPSQVVAYSFSIGTGDEGSAGTLWLDELSLLGAEGQPPAEEEPPAEEQPPSEEEQPPAEETPEGSGGKSLCPFSAIVLPLGALAVVFARRRRQ